MAEQKRTPGQAEGTEQDVENALRKQSGQNEEARNQSRTGGWQRDEDLDREPGRTPGQAEGTEEQADGSLRKQG